MLAQHSTRVGRDGSARFLVRPGLTGLAQVSGRNAISWEERLHFDKRWVEGIGISSAIAILARTATVVVTGRGIDGHDPCDPIVIGEEPILVGERIGLDEDQLAASALDRSPIA